MGEDYDRALSTSPGTFTAAQVDGAWRWLLLTGGRLMYGSLLAPVYVEMINSSWDILPSFNPAQWEA